MMIGVPELANQPSGRVEVRGIAEVVRKVAGVGKVGRFARALLHIVRALHGASDVGRCRR